MGEKDAVNKKKRKKRNYFGLSKKCFFSVCLYLVCRRRWGSGFLPCGSQPWKRFLRLVFGSADKWLGAYHPMGLGFFGRRRSKGIIETFIAQMQATGELDDPLLRYVKDLEDAIAESSGETVSLGSLFSCQGAAYDMAATTDSAAFQNRTIVAELADETDWRPLLPQLCFRSRILLLQANRLSVRNADPQALRANWHLNGIAMTSYANGIIRLSMPNESLKPNEIVLLHRTLQATA